MMLARPLSRVLPAALLSLAVISCSGSPSDSPVLTAEVPLHLEEHLDAATVLGSEVPVEVPAALEWHFDEPQSEWQPTVPWNPTVEAPRVTYTEGALRVTLTERTRGPSGRPRGGLSLDLPDWSLEDWEYVVVRARTSEIRGFGLGLNRREGTGTATDNPFPFEFRGDGTPVVNDGAVQTYQLRADWSNGIWKGPLRQLGLWIGARETPASIDILSISLIPKEANYAGEPVGTREEVRNKVYRRALYTHAPGRLEYRVRIPDAARLDVGLGVLREDAPVTFRVTASAGDGTHALFEESYADKTRWGQRSVDLSELAGQTATLALETDSDLKGSVALWGAPTLTRGEAIPREPNVIFYVIDGGAADFLSSYGYNRRTTPNIARLATQGSLFERAYSNSSWTRPSTASFMTSLQNSVMGGFLNWNDPIPEKAVTMAEHMHRAGYQTGVFTANPNAGTLSNLKRSVDMFREDWNDFAYFGGQNHRESSRFLHEGFWEWREAYPAEPYWVHFQTTDTHGDFPSVPPFAGLFVSSEQFARWDEWRDQLREEGGWGIHSDAWESTGIDRAAFFSVWRSLYDEAMAHTDYQIGRLVERLKADGEWENTLLVIGGDHSTRNLLPLGDSVPPRWNRPILQPTTSRVPLIFVWPGHIKGAQRFSQPVSVIDVLPTILDLVNLPMPEIMMGQSLAPLLLGEEAWEPRPVIFDEFQVDRETDELRGKIEVVDGRWGASLEINPWPPDEDETEEEIAEWQRPVPLLLYDLWNDHWCLSSVHEEHPDLVEKYTAFLQEQWEAHQSLAQYFTRSEDTALTPEQLKTLRTLGYIQ
jgi:arylsulfatase A-like enzyme